ncbi:MAG: hypothetical protein LJE65_11410 [Desulfobacteraceae bacterium]|nr:hypothetical protein [Desulfobacteraceae bacterium]
MTGRGGRSPRRFTVVFLAAALGLCTGVSPESATAGDFDGSKPLSGTVERIVAVHPDRVVEDLDPETVGLPKAFRIDFRARTIRPSADSLVRKILSIQRITKVEQKIVLQGVDEGIEGVEDAMAWSLALSTTDGKAVLSAAGGGVAYVVYGTCKPVEDND